MLYDYVFRSPQYDIYSSLGSACFFLGFQIWECLVRFVMKDTEGRERIKHSKTPETLAPAAQQEGKCCIIDIHIKVKCLGGCLHCNIS